MRRNTVEMTPQDELHELEQAFQEQNPGMPTARLTAGVDPITASREQLSSADVEPATATITVPGEVISAKAAVAPTPLTVFGAKAEAAAPRSSRRATAEPAKFVPADLPKFPAAPHRKQPEAPAESVAGSVVMRPNVRGARRLYRTDERGKLRPVSYATVLTEQGHAGDYQGKEKAPKKAPAAAAATVPLAHDFTPRTADMDAAARDALFANLRQTRQAEAVGSPRLERAKRLGKAVLRAPRRTMDALNAVDDKILGAPTAVKNTLAIKERADKLNGWGLKQEAIITESVKNRLETVRRKQEAVATQLDKLDALPAVIGRKALEQAVEQGRSLKDKTKETLLRRKRTVAAGALAILALAGAGLSSSPEQVDARAAAATTAPSPEQPKLSAAGLATVFEALNGTHMTISTPKAAPETSAQRATDAAPATPKKPEVKPTPSAPETLTVHDGDQVWNVLSRAGIPETAIMQRLDAAAKASGLPYEWHGSGTHRWLEVDGKSDASSVVKTLDKFIKR